MINIYKCDNTEYDKNGDMTLFPDTANVSAELNGAWTATLEHPIDPRGRWKYIVENAVVRMPSFNGNQLFRIKNVQKRDSGISAQMEPIFYDAIGDCWLVDVRPIAKTGQEALDIMLAPNSKYSASSDITHVTTAYYEYLNFFEALNGDIDQSFINRWGGEILYNNFQIIVNEHVGGDYGVEIRYGKNIPKDGLIEEIDVSGVVTRIYPKAYNGYTMTENGKVDSPLINSYPIVYSKTMTFSDVKMREDAQENDEENGITICDTQEELDAALTERCKEQYEAGLDKPTVTISADMVLLQNTEQYKNYKVLEEVSLGDTVHCRHNKLEIVTNARVISLTYDSIRKKVSNVTLGDYMYNYFDDVTSSANKIEQVIRPDGTVMAEKIQGILNGIYTQLWIQSTAAQKVNGVAFKVEDLDPESQLYGCMVWGTQGLQISTTRTADGKDWDWTTAVTANGIIANAIIAGILSDKEGKNYWNLDTGEFRLSAEAFKIDDKTPKDFFESFLTQKVIFDKLTNNGETQGIYLQDGKLYLNGEYMQIGIITGVGGKNLWNLNTGEFQIGDYMHYIPKATEDNPGVNYQIGGWQIKTNQNVWDYDEVIYWDTEQTQENGICARGPWVVWGGWNGGESLDYVNNYKFVVSDKGDVYGQKFFDNGQQLLPMIRENMHTVLTGNYCRIKKEGYFLVNCELIASAGYTARYVGGTQRETDGTYTVVVEGGDGGEIDMYVTWCKEPD